MEHATPVNSPSPAALLTAAVYVRYEESTLERERDDLERVLLFDGLEHTNPYTSTPSRGSWIYTPSENSWFHLSSNGQPPDCVGHSLTTLCRNTVVLYGGISVSNITHRDSWTFETGELPPPGGDVWVFDGIREVWQEVEPSGTDNRPQRRAFHSASVIGKTGDCYCRQSIFIFGGIMRSHPSGPPDLLHDLWELRLEPVSEVQSDRGQWKQQWRQYHQKKELSWPAERFRHSAISIEDGTMLMFGGTLRNQEKYIQDTYIWVFNVSSSTWDRRSYSHLTNPSAQVSGAIIFNSTGSVLFQVQSGRVYTFTQIALAPVWTEDVTSVGKSTPVNLANFAAVVVGPAIIVFAGIEPHTTFLRMRVWSIEMINSNWVCSFFLLPEAALPFKPLRLGML